LPREDEGVDVGIPQTRDQVAPRTFDNGCTVEIGSRARGPDLGDAVPLDDDGHLGTRRRSRGIDDCHVGDRDWRVRRSLSRYACQRWERAVQTAPTGNGSSHEASPRDSPGQHGLSLLIHVRWLGLCPPRKLLLGERRAGCMTSPTTIDSQNRSIMVAHSGDRGSPLPSDLGTVRHTCACQMLNASHTHPAVTSSPWATRIGGLVKNCGM
jgi:hypothetical protein